MADPSPSTNEPIEATAQAAATRPRRAETYQWGIRVVALTVAVSALLCILTVGASPSGPAGRAALSLEARPLALGSFRLIERSGRAVGDAELAGRVWIAAFIFTRCPSSCPRISAVMKGLQEKLSDTGVRLVSISVDPTHDTPEVLTRYAIGLGASDDRWWFLTGAKEDVYRLILDRFKLAARPSTELERASGAEDVAHSSRLALVERGNRVIGYFSADDPAEVGLLATRARKADSVWEQRLPTFNALLNGSCAVLLLLGWVVIRGVYVRAHKLCMLASLGLSAVFLGCYLFYHFVVVRGSVPFQGVGRPIRIAYFSILVSHTVLAIAIVPLVFLTVSAALRNRFDRHVRLAKLTFPIWLYVSITGVVVYWMLYRMDFSNFDGLASF